MIHKTSKFIEPFQTWAGTYLPANALFSLRIGYYCVMKVEAVNINFKKMALAFREHVRLKALNAGSNIIYLKNGQLVEENPKDSSIQIRRSGLFVAE